MIKRQLKRIVVITLGVIFILLGLAGLVLPILQGWLFLAIGALLLSIYSPTLRGWMNTHTVKYPKIHKFVGRAQSWVERVFGAPEV
jgi:uncharacterized membrane protein YbaN (DUF454 family)